MQIIPYFDQLRALAAEHGVNLRDAFAAAGVSSSTFRRTRRNATQLRLGTTRAVARAIRAKSRRP